MLDSQKSLRFIPSDERCHVLIQAKEKVLHSKVMHGVTGRVGDKGMLGVVHTPKGRVVKEFMHQDDERFFLSCLSLGQ